MLIVGALLSGPAMASSTVYKWTDDQGTVHLSTTRPAAGVKYETLKLDTASGQSSRPQASTGAGSGKSTPAATPAQVGQRSEVLSGLQNRECVIALEALDRLTSGTRPTSAAELTRLKQTVDRNCSKDAARRRDQEDMAAKLRVANGPECVAARNKLADMMAPGAQVSRESRQAQQAFVDDNCMAPVQ
jgi:hypothetical protein